MEEIIYVDYLEEVPKDFTGIVKTGACPPTLISRIVGYNIYWFIKGSLVMSSTSSGVRYHDHSWRVIAPSFEVMFDRLTDEEKEVIIWNWDYWKKR